MVRPTSTATWAAVAEPAPAPEGLPAGRVVVTGATGFVGGALARHLAAAGAAPRLVVRDAARAPVLPGSEVAEADVGDARAMRRALEGAEALVYLVHSMAGPRGEEFRERDRNLAAATREAAEEAGVGRIVYLGGLGSDRDAELSEHLASRHEVARVLAAGAPRVTELRAAIVVGPGGASWEMLRQLVAKLPVMVCPRWVRTRCQPVALRDVVASIEACLVHPETAGRSYDVGGPDVLTYRRMMEVVGELMGRVPVIVEVPVLTPSLSALWVDLVTETPRAMAHALIEGLRNDVVCLGPSLGPLLPAPPLGFREAARLALEGRA